MGLRAVDESYGKFNSNSEASDEVNVCDKESEPQVEAAQFSSDREGRNVNMKPC